MILVAEQVVTVILMQRQIWRIVVVRPDQVVVTSSASVKVWIVPLSTVVVRITKREVVEVVAISAMTAAVTTAMVIVVVTSMMIVVVIIVSS